VPNLRALKLGQVIRQEGPQAHHSKAGTPTMGGLLVVPVGVIVGSLVAPSDPRLPAVAAITLAFMAIGGFDDWRSLTRRTNTGLSPRGKLLLQALAAALFLLVAAWNDWISRSVGLPFGLALSLGLLILPLGLFVFLAESNATNLTDGLDGLAAGCGAVVFAGFGVQLMLRGHLGDPALAGFCAAMAGTWLGFLAHNHHPARMFMGDTGSLAMGAALSAVALLSDSLWPLLLMGGVFVAESLSVILQVWVFKATKGADGSGPPPVADGPTPPPLRAGRSLRATGGGGILDDQLAAGGHRPAAASLIRVAAGASWGQADGMASSWCYGLFHLERKGADGRLRQPRGDGFTV